MKLTFVGCGSAFTTSDYWQSNMILECGDRKMLIDCGSDARFSLAEQGIQAADIDDIYISHLHADHVGGLEWMALSRKFNSARPKPRLIMNRGVMESLWENVLKGGLETLEGEVATLTTYFECRPLNDNESFRWLSHSKGPYIDPVQTVHVMSGYKIQNSYGLFITDPLKDQRIFITTDTQFCPHQIRRFYEMATLIFQDCETGFKSGVHAHYDDLATLNSSIKKKMWLYHHNPNPSQNATKDGFLGFVKKGQSFDLFTPNQ